MIVDKKDYEAFVSEYKSEEQEILALFSDKSGGAGKEGGKHGVIHNYFVEVLVESYQ